jgi:hypothetical protein
VERVRVGGYEPPDIMARQSRRYDAIGEFDMKSKLICILLMLSAVTAFASNPPYQGEQLRTIKALSESEINSLLNGQGMGFAKAAELNHYPGPKHVLDIADDLDLTDEQISKTTLIFSRMKTEAIRLGKELVDSEAKLDKLFKIGTITAEELDKQVSAIGETRARLRGVHLKAHLAQRTVLTQHQLHKYDNLRGYSGGNKNHSHSSMSHN